MKNLKDKEIFTVYTLVSRGYDDTWDQHTNPITYDKAMYSKKELEAEHKTVRILINVYDMESL